MLRKFVICYPMHTILEAYGTFCDELCLIMILAYCVWRIAYPLASLRTGFEFGGASRHPTTSAPIKYGGPGIRN